MIFRLLVYNQAYGKKKDRSGEREGISFKENQKTPSDKARDACLADSAFVATSAKEAASAKWAGAKKVKFPKASPEGGILSFGVE